MLPPHVDHRAGLRVPFLDRLAALTSQTPHAGDIVAPRRWFRLAALGLCWLLTVVALMAPQWIEPPLHRDRPTRDLLVLVDLSGSMQTKDFANASGELVERLTAVKQVLVSSSRGERGIGSALWCLATRLSRSCPSPPTWALPHAASRHGGRHGRSEDGLRRRDRMGIGLFDRSVVKTKTMIALTDGNDTGSKVPPREAAAIAKDKGIVIHTVAIGDPTAVGEDKLDEQALKDVSATTGGGFFRALDRNQLDEIYDRSTRSKPKRSIASRSGRSATSIGSPRCCAPAFDALPGRSIAFRSVPPRTEPRLKRRRSHDRRPDRVSFRAPALLFCLVPAVALWRLGRRFSDPAAKWRRVIDPELLPTSSSTTKSVSWMVPK